ncbi:DNA-(apurinic or apyrimidinic site) endonuclease 2-like [Apodemus sylvaticus]|uniref:DNA-(apurinic or apyrimidinic site) endonuclease 2-like n=1 Tax=Apodemus sylvaticus TaxID=10129 RepID=UPI00224257F8|nr:DNA-(apurinic or apyrimidinic site) endonuclease 2-like [Apodemus sylvaticus]
MLRVVSWNINGIRRPLQGLGHKVPSNCPTALRHILKELDADVVCLQEIKVSRDTLPEPLAVVEGYNSYFSFSRSRSGYSGVATFCKDTATPVAAEEGLSGQFATLNGHVGCYGNMNEFTQEQLRALDSEGRAVLTQHKIYTQEGKEKLLTLINVYCPHADPGNPERLTFKMHFYRLLQIRAEALLAAGSHVIILGDMNTAHRPIDHCDAGNLECFEEDLGRKWMDSLLNNPEYQAGSHIGPFMDSYRYFYPKQERAFTCWSAIHGARSLNYGTRLDYVLGDRTLITDTFQDAFLLPEVMGSDHCPVGAVLNVSCVPAKQCPALCTRFLPEFSGTQLKILGFLVPCEQEPMWEQSVPQPSKQVQPQKQRKAQAHGHLCRPQKYQGCSRRHQKTLLGYFQPSVSLSQTSGVELPKLPLVGTVVTPTPLERDMIATGTDKQDQVSEVRIEKEARASFWKSVLSGPSPMPLCRGHREPCVMRVVKKSGPNLGRHFYICAKPQGPPNDPSSSCNFFLWSKPR